VGLGLPWGGPIDVTAPAKRRRPEIRVHRSSTLTRPDVTRHFGIPVTSLARTLLDLAAILDDRTLTRAVNEARLLRRGLAADLAALLTRSRGRATGPSWSRFLDSRGPTRSTLEERTSSPSCPRLKRDCPTP
jgi:hypothetical protein